MCGINGYISFQNETIKKNIIEKMSCQTQHRGPDAKGIWMKDNIGLAHNRLKIIDLSDLASQPMRSKNGRYVIVYNGEIYNFKDIRKILENQGVIFETNSDTEVVLNSLIFYGVSALSKFNGMFALAFFDIETKNLIVARDRYGIKPLYFSLTSNYFAFSSETRSLKNLNPQGNNLDLDALHEYIIYQNILSNKTLTANIKILNPGNFLKLNIESREYGLNEYWRYPNERINDERFERDYLEELDHHLNNAVERNLTSDVEVGAYLSGGIDSATIAALTSSKSPNLKTFTIGFESRNLIEAEKNYDESQKASEIAKILKTTHFERTIMPRDFTDNFDHLIDRIEEPRLGQSYPNYIAAKFAREKVKVVLSGIGGDEIFGGYPWRYKFREYDTHKEFLDDLYFSWHRIIDPALVSELLYPINKKIEKDAPRKEMENIIAAFNPNVKSKEDAVTTCMYFEFKTFLHSLLVIEDKISMTFGLESRVPFLDNDVVDFALQLPLHMKFSEMNNHVKLNNGQRSKEFNRVTKTSGGKYILRKQLEKNLPVHIAQRPKQGFSSPDKSWYPLEIEKMVHKILRDKDKNIFEVLDYKFVKSLIDSQNDVICNRRLFIWSFLSLAKILDEYAF